MDLLNLEEYLKCQNCLDIVENPYELDCCGKLCCFNCTKNMLQCTPCNIQAAYRKNVFASRILKQMEITCKYGCGVKFPYLSMKKHMTSCLSKVFKCKIESCEYNGKRDEFVLHIIENHHKQVIALSENFDDFSIDFTKLFYIVGTSKNEEEVKMIKKSENLHNYYSNPYYDELDEIRHISNYPDNKNIGFSDEEDNNSRGNIDYNY